MAIKFNDGNETFAKPKSFLKKVKEFFAPKAPVFASPIPDVTPTPTPTLTPISLSDRFKKGFESYGSNLATASAKFSEQAQNNPLPDPFLPAVISLMETSGGKKQRYAFNPFNWGMQDMPSLDKSIERIYSGISKRFPYYADYLKSGKLEDFFKVYTPPNKNNPSNEELVRRYNLLKKNFD